MYGRRLHVCVLLGCVVLPLVRSPAVALATPKEYEVRLHRPDKVGDRFDVKCEAATIRGTTVVVGEERREQPGEAFGIKLVGTVEVLATTPKGKATRISVVVRKCVRVAGDAEKELVAPGKTILAEVKGKETAFSLKYGTLPPEAQPALELAFRLSDKDDRGNDDLLFGTAKKQRVGGTWPASAEQAVKEFALEDVGVAKEDVSGGTTLDGVTTINGVECLKLSGELVVKNIKPTAGADRQLPPGVTAAGGTLRHRFKVTLPVDPSIPALEEAMSARHMIPYTGTGPTGHAMRTETTIQKAAELKRKPLKGTGTAADKTDR